MRMKKFILISVAALVMLATMSCTSCGNSDAPWGVEYSLQSDGQTDDNVAAQFFNANLFLNGGADYVFEWTNVIAPAVLQTTQAVVLNDALTCSDIKTAQAAEYVNDWLDEWFKVVSFDGTYDIYIKGYVKETKTQITFSIDRHFTNIPPNADDATVDPE